MNPDQLGKELGEDSQLEKGMGVNWGSFAGGGGAGSWVFVEPKGVWELVGGHVGQSWVSPKPAFLGANSPKIGPLVGCWVPPPRKLAWGSNSVFGGAEHRPPPTLLHPP